MSAKADVLYGSENLESRLPEIVAAPVEVPQGLNRWNPEQFAQEQILSLVRELFLASGTRSIRQVVLSAVESRINVAPICEQIARTLSSETSSEVALVDWLEKFDKKPSLYAQSRNSSSLKSHSAPLAANLWRVGRNCFGEDDSPAGMQRLSWLAKLRDEFEFAVIVGPPAGVSSEAALLGQITDGLILVIGAHSTRKATAKQIIRTLQASQSRILGTVLCDRTFPIPQRLYSRL